MDVHHESGDRGEFFLIENGKKIGILSYKMLSPEFMIIESTYVSPAHREHGYGHHMIQAAVAHAREHKIKIDTTCSFVRRVFYESDKYNDVTI